MLQGKDCPEKKKKMENSSLANGLSPSRTGPSACRSATLITLSRSSSEDAGFGGSEYMTEKRDTAQEAWNHHRLISERDKTRVAIYESSRQAAITRAYWTGDPDDDIGLASDPLYGVDGEAPFPPPETTENEGLERLEQPEGAAAQRSEDARRLLGDFDCDRDDGNWGIAVYCEAAVRMISNISHK
ncbi:hypothetical protein C8J57DRAFT_1235825 [Mycena rebaudengoi]|nr:hypothetical protein C8J57DRAFT_1235825 [Mycena rebaudengoi]